MVRRPILIRAEVLVLSSPSDFLIASSRKPLVGNSLELSIRGAQGEARRVFRRASARPPRHFSALRLGLLSFVLEV